jgi:hypothetical protein
MSDSDDAQLDECVACDGAADHLPIRSCITCNRFTHDTCCSVEQVRKHTHTLAHTPVHVPTRTYTRTHTRAHIHTRARTHRRTQTHQVPSGLAESSGEDEDEEVQPFYCDEKCRQADSATLPSSKCSVCQTDMNNDAAACTTCERPVHGTVPCGVAHGPDGQSYCSEACTPVARGALRMFLPQGKCSLRVTCTWSLRLWIGSSRSLR